MIKRISVQTLRRLAIHKQRLSEPRAPANAEGVLDVLRSIRCLQIDPIRAVERTQYLVLFSRLGPFKTELLDKAAYEDRLLFEYTAHAASYVLTEDYPIHRHAMLNRKQSAGVWAERFREWRSKNQDFEKYILDTIRKEGPRLTAEIEDRSSKLWDSSAWWSSRNTALMIQSMWDRGILMVSRRDGLKKYWDVAERVHPDWDRLEPLEGLALTTAAAQLSLKALGTGTARHIRNHFTRGRYPGLETALKELEENDRITRIEIADSRDAFDDKNPWYVHSDDLPLIDSLDTGQWAPRTVLLSPFDNLIADRDRTELLWDFFFRIEIYVPAKKREYGYYVMPILHGDRLIGRIDPQMDRNSDTLEIRTIYMEPGAPEDGQTVGAIRTAIEELGTFLNARQIAFTGDIPAGWQGLK